MLLRHTSSSRLRLLKRKRYLLLGEFDLAIRVTVSPEATRVQPPIGEG